VRALALVGVLEPRVGDGTSIYHALVARDAERAAAADVMHLGIAEEWLRKFLAQGQMPGEPGPATASR
jgi:hypothetical protein